MVVPRPGIEPGSPAWKAGILPVDDRGNTESPRGTVLLGFFLYFVGRRLLFVVTDQSLGEGTLGTIFT